MAVSWGFAGLGAVEVRTLWVRAIGVSAFKGRRAPGFWEIAGYHT
jgi:hypothetical protein